MKLNIQGSNSVVRVVSKKNTYKIQVRDSLIWRTVKSNVHFKDLDYEVKRIVEVLTKKKEK